MKTHVLSSRISARFPSLVFLFALGALGSPLSGQVISDNFDDGNDDGWTRSNPLQPVGGSANWLFPEGNSYRIMPNPSPDPGSFGPGRAGSFREDANYTDSFFVSVDLIDWVNVDLEHDAGILAFINTPGLGTLNSYAFSYDVDAGTFFLSKIVGEEASGLDDFDAALDPLNNYRLVFQGFNGEMRGEVFFLDPDFEISLGFATASDISYTSGSCGLFAAHGVQDGRGISDATFDNYFSSPDTDIDVDGMTDQWEVDNFGDLARPGTEDFDNDGLTDLEEFMGGTDPKNPDDPGAGFELLSVSSAGGEFTVTFPIAADHLYQLETSPDLETWTPQPGAVFVDNGATGALTLSTGGATELFGRVTETAD